MRTPNIESLSLADIEVIAHCALLPELVDREIHALSNLSLHGLIEIISQENGDDLESVRFAVQTYAARIEDIVEFQRSIRAYFELDLELRRAEQRVHDDAMALHLEQTHQLQFNYHN